MRVDQSVGMVAHISQIGIQTSSTNVPQTRLQIAWDRDSRSRSPRKERPFEKDPETRSLDIALRRHLKSPLGANHQRVIEWRGDAVSPLGVVQLVHTYN